MRDIGIAYSDWMYHEINIPNIQLSLLDWFLVLQIPWASPTVAYVFYQLL